MQTIKAYEFKDLNKDIQLLVYNQVLNEVIELKLDILNDLLLKGIISENDYYNTIGCSKYYAEVTSWFIPSCYYEHNKREVNNAIKENLSFMLFNEFGKFIQNKS